MCHDQVPYAGFVARLLPSDSVLPTGTEQSAWPRQGWERLQGQAAIAYDKAMQSMVTAALPLCNKGTHTLAVHFMKVCNILELITLATILSLTCVAEVCDLHSMRLVAESTTGGQPILWQECIQV